MEQIDQILAHAVVASFIHHNRHPAQNPLVPALGLSGVPEGTTWVGGGEVVALLYNCSTDLALRVEPLPWLDCMSQCLNSRGIFVMSIMLHHRLFLQDAPRLHALPRSNITAILQSGGALAAYKSLATYNVVKWPQRVGCRELVDVPPYPDPDPADDVSQPHTD